MVAPLDDPHARRPDDDRIAGPDVPGDASDPDDFAELFEDDLPCIQCGYNLRGLSRDRKCPECGRPVVDTLDKVNTTMLCPACLAPNHPLAVKCAQCGNAIAGAAAAADYYRNRSGLANTSRRRPLTSLLLLWFFLGPLLALSLAGLVGTTAHVVKEEVVPTILDWVVLMISLAAGAISAPILFLATKGYGTRPSEEADADISPDDRTEPDDDV